MKGRPALPRDRDMNDYWDRRITALEKRIKQLEENQRPTIPIYDSTNFPLEAAEGQIAIAPS